MKKYTALIIEDDRDDAELIKLELNKLDFTFDFAIVNSEPELHAFLGKATPDIVISDYNMPGFTGLDALMIVREQKSDLPFILCSGFIGEEQAADAVRKGVNDYCLKNNLKRLCISVERELKNYELQRERKLDQQLVQATFNASGLSVAIMDKDGIFTKVNDQFAELSGYTPEELIGMSYLRLNEADKREEARRIFNKILSGSQAHTNEWKLIRKDGSVCYVQSTITRINNGGLGNYIISYVQDVTEQKQLRAIRKHSEMMSNVGGWEMDLVLDRVYCNGVVLDIFDLPDGLELTAETLTEKLDEESQKIFIDAIEQTVKDGLAFDKILQSVKNNGAKKLIRVSGVPQTVNGHTVRVYGTFRNVTEEEKKNEEIRKLSLVASKTHNGVIIFNDEVKIEWVNDSFLKATGYESEDYIGTGFGDLLVGKETDPETIKKVKSKFQKGKPFKQEILIYTKEGEKKWFEIDVTPVYDEVKEKQKFIGIQEDITKRKQLENESERSRLLLETISDKAEAAIWVRDSEGRHLFVNQEWKNIFELNDQEIIGKTAFEILDEATAREFQKNDTKVLDSNQSIKYEERVPTLKGDRHYLTNMFPMGLIPGVGKSTGGIATDITERKQMEEELKFNSRLLDEIGEAVISTDPDGKIIYWNRTAEQLFGWPQSEVLGQNIIDITPSKVSKELASEIFSLLLKGESWSGEFEVERKDGTGFPAMVTNSPVHDDEGNLLAVIGISSDITERKANEQKLRKSLKEKELLLAEVHHRVKNNLAIISSLITLQMLEVEDENFRKILENSNNRIHSIAMVHELLYKAESFTEIPFEQYIINLVDAIKKTIGFEKKDVSVKIEVQVDDFNINQAIPLGLLLNELITNSLKYAFINRKKGKIIVNITRSGNNIKVLYEDNGEGYPDHIDFTDTGSLGHTLIHTLLKQLRGDFNVETKGKFRLEFQFEERKKGAHSNLSG